jgi:hypothetical protein
MVSSTSPTTAVNSVSRRFEKTTSSSILAIFCSYESGNGNAEGFLWQRRD